MSEIFEQLLALQDADTTLSQLAYRRENLPEREELNSVESDLVKIASLIATIEAQRAPHMREQKRIDDEIAVVAEKSARDNKALYSGSITDSKELQNLQKEIDSLAQRNEGLENELLEVMLIVEESDGQLVEVNKKGSALEAQKVTLLAAIELAESEIDAELGIKKSEAQGLRSIFDEELLARYDKVATKSGGLAVVFVIDGGTCSGCRHPLSMVEVAKIRSAIELSPCSHCKRLLVPGV